MQRSSEHMIVTIDAKDFAEFGRPVVERENGYERSQTVFSLEAENGCLGMVGTFDEILAMAAGIVTAMYSWPLVSGHSEWFDASPEAIQDGGTIYVIQGHSRNGSAGERGSCTGSAGDSSSQSYDS